MGLFDKLKSMLLVSDDQLLARRQTAAQSEQATLHVPSSLDCESILSALMNYGREAGLELNNGVEQQRGSALMASVKNQVIKMHEEILKCYKKRNQTPDEKLLNKLTVVNIFYLAMGSAILAKVKRSNLIAQGVFQKLLMKSGPDLFYREVAALAGNKYGSEEVEALHQLVQRVTYLLLTECDKLSDGRHQVIECGKAMYMFGLCVSLKEKQQLSSDSL